jgi:hypothetical protein
MCAPAEHHFSQGSIESAALRCGLTSPLQIKMMGIVLAAQRNRTAFSAVVFGYGIDKGASRARSAVLRSPLHAGRKVSTMSVLYSILPLDEQVVAWMGEHEVTPPAGWSPGRYPTPAEVRQTLETLEGYRVDYRVTPRSWSAVIEDTAGNSDGRWATIDSIGYAGSDDNPLHIYFSRGWREVIVRITERLTSVCGPLIIVPDSVAYPHLVTPGADPGEVLRLWHEMEDQENEEG